MQSLLPAHRPALVLAPMQDVTDLPFMKIMAQRGGPDWFVTEFFRIHSVARLEPYILRSIDENTTGIPIFAQIIGSDVDALVKAAKNLQRHPIAGIDLNMGCPSPTVCGKNAGGGLLRDAEEMHRMLGSLRDAITGRFTVKTRVGYYDEREFDQLLEIIQRHEINGLTIHARTVKDRYQTPIRPQRIKQAVESSPFPIIANGNVINTTAAKNLINLTNAQGLMIGRGAIRNPWMFDQIRASYLQEKIYRPTTHDLHLYLSELYEELAKESRNYREHLHVQRMKKTMLYIVQGLGDEFENAMRRVKTEEELFSLWNHFLVEKIELPDTPPESSKLFCGFSELLDLEKNMQ